MNERELIKTRFYFYVLVGKDFVNNFINCEELYHYGIKGMKWGVRRSKQELALDPASRAIAYNRLIQNGFTTKYGNKITKVSKEIIEEKRIDRTQSPNDVINALKHPLGHDSVKYDKQGRPSIRYYGRKAIVNINPDNGIIITSWVMSKNNLEKTRRKIRDGEIQT